MLLRRGKPAATRAMLRIMYTNTDAFLVLVWVYMASIAVKYFHSVRKLA